MKLVLFDDGGKEVGFRNYEHNPKEMDATEYGLGIKAKELYRDFLYREGLYDDFRRQPGHGTFWDA